jgi:hypothetical protein
MPGKDRLEFLEPETQLLSALDEDQQVDALLVIDTLSALPLSGRQQADRLVMADALDRRPGALCGLADVHEKSLFAVVTPGALSAHSVAGDSLGLP